MPGARIRQDGTRVLLELSSPAVVIPWEQAIEIGRLLIEAGRKAESEAKRELIIADTALSMRAGLGIDLSNGDEVVKAEAKKLAEWDSVYRRRLPQANASAEVFAPTIIQERKPNGHTS